MKPKKVKWGIVATEKAYGDLITFFQHSANAEIGAIASSAELLGDPCIDAVYIPKLNPGHYELILRAAKAKKHILCNSTAGLSQQNIGKIMNQCKEHGVLFEDALMHENHAKLNRIKQWVQSESLGHVKIIRASVARKIDNKEGALRSLGWACVDMINYLLDDEPVSVTASGTITKDGIDTTVLALLTYPNQIHAVFDCSLEMNLQPQYQIQCTQGTLTFSAENMSENLQSQGFEYVSNCILQDMKAAYSGLNIWSNSKVIDSIAESLRQRNARSVIESDESTMDDGWGEECGIAAFLRR